MMPVADKASQGPLRAEWVLHVVVFLAACLVMHKVWLHPGEVIYSDHSDILAQHYPSRFVLVDSVLAYGELPLWNRYTFSGMPLLGDPQSGLFYPLNWLHCLVPADQTAAVFGWLILLHLAIAGSGMLVWLREYQLSAAARVVGAFSFMLSGKWFLHVVVPGHVVFLPLAWLPWQLALVDRLWREPALRHAGLLALISGVAFFGLHPQSFFYASILLGAYGVWRGCAGPRGGLRASAGLFAAASALSLALVLVQLWPAIELAAQCLRGAGLQYEFAARDALKPGNLIAFLLPGVVGPKGWEVQPYLGIVPLALGLFAWADRRRRGAAAFFTAMLVFMVLHALGPQAGVHRFLFRWVPGFHLFRLPTRILLLGGLPVGFLAAVGSQSLLSDMGKRFKFVVALVVAIGGAVLFWARPGIGAAISWIFLMAPACVVTAMTGGARKTAAGLLVVLTLTNLAWFAVPLVQTRRLADALGDNPIADLMVGSPGHYRVHSLGDEFAASDPLPQAYSVPARVELLRGFNPLVPRRTYHYLIEGVGGQPPHLTQYEVIGNFAIRQRAYFDLLGVRYVASPSPLHLPNLSLVREFTDLYVYHYALHGGGRTHMPRVYLYENLTALPRAFLVPGARPASSDEDAFRMIQNLDARITLPLEGLEEPREFSGGGRFEITTATANSLSVDGYTDHGGYLLITEMWYPGWEAWEGDERLPILRAAGTFCAIPLGPGKHSIRLRYFPRSYQVGRVVSVLALIAIAFAVTRGRYPWAGGRRPARQTCRE
jgi:hypothetical protein